ncbi:hypothetical protein BC826DRAFT_650705 [Russula brevipes]|nr:hypothetical protein BC826DRAFT_650705 [Russula brevipes]
MGSHSHPRKRVCHQVSAVASNVSPALALLPKIPESWTRIPTRGPSRELVIRGHSVHHKGETRVWGRRTRRRQVTIDILPDDVLLEIFNVYTDEYSLRWPTLVHICRRWRSVVFASTRRLNLQLRCTYKTPVRKALDIWPALPIVVAHLGHEIWQAKGADHDNIVAALGNPDRVRQIVLWNTPKSDLDQFAGAMQEPFPTLTYLNLRVRERDAVFVLPDSFLGGAAPRLQALWLYGASFPTIPNLLSSASDLVDLRLWEIPHPGFFSPEEMVNGLSALTRLNTLRIGFRSPQSRPDQPSRPRWIRTVFPALNNLAFQGVSEYLEDFTSRIDAPLLSDLRITFFNQLIFNTPQLYSFISHAKQLRSQDQAQMEFSDRSVRISAVGPGHSRYSGLFLEILCKASDWQLSSLTQFISTTTLARRCGAQPMAGTSTPIYHRETFIPIQWFYTTCRICLARALWGKNNGRITRATKYFLASVRATGTCQGSRCVVSHCAAALRSSCDRQFVQLVIGINVRKMYHR